MIAKKPPILRILKIHRMVSGRHHPNVPSLARLLGVSMRTVRRDIEFLRDSIGAPIAYNPIERGYEYTEEPYRFPEVEMSEGEILALDETAILSPTPGRSATAGQKNTSPGKDRNFQAVLRFDRTLAPYLLESERGRGFRIQTLTNGGVELSFRSENGDAVIRYCLGWGLGAEVISPPWVRRRARQMLRQLSKRYEGRVRSIAIASRKRRTRTKGNRK